MSSRIPVIVLVALTCGCGADLPASSFIDKLRILAVQAEPPEAAPGQVVALQLLAVEPPVPHLGPVEPLDALWLACGEPSGVTTPLPCGVSGDSQFTGKLPPLCKDDPTAPLCEIDTGLSAALTPTRAALGSDGTGSILLTVVVADAPGGALQCLSDVAMNNGIPQNPDHCVIALKRLVVSDPNRATTDGKPVPPPNRNPQLALFTLAPVNGAAASLTDGTAHFPAGPQSASYQLAAVRADGSAELKPDGTYEAMSLSWFTTAGKIDSGRSAFDPPGCDSQANCATTAPIAAATTPWATPTTAELAVTADATGTVNFWAVLRDDRGGVGFLQGYATPSPIPSSSP